MSNSNKGRGKFFFGILGFVILAIASVGIAAGPPETRTLSLVVWIIGFLITFNYYGRG